MAQGNTERQQLAPSASAGAMTDGAGELSNALALHRQGDLDQARLLYEAVLQREPGHYDALNLRGIVSLQSNGPADAIVWFRRAVALRPAVAVAHRNLGQALDQVGRPDEAVACFERALAAHPTDAETLVQHGRALHKLGQLAAAADSFRKAIALRPEHPDGYNGLGAVLDSEARPDEALAQFDRVLALRPNYAKAHSSRGNALLALGRAEEALLSHQRAVALAPDDAELEMNHSLALLTLGRMDAGWRTFEARKRRSRPVGVKPQPSPAWLGETEIEGRTLLVFSEQGLGDTLQFCRYLPLLEARGARVLFDPQPALRRLLRSMTPPPTMIAADAPPLQADAHIALMSLPLALGTQLDSIPAEVPYLYAEPQRVSEWRARIGEHGFRIGISWQGSLKPVDVGRSLPVAAFAGIAALPGVRLISLQKGKGVEQLERLPPGMTVETLDKGFDGGPDAFLDTAAVMEVCDLVITSDTATAHLAGALGRPVWVLLKSVPDWRWMLDRPDSPWYPTMRLFRQTTRGDWSPVFAAVEAALRRLPGGPGPIPVPLAPAAWGEIVDKITILEIKSERLSSADQRANVRTELEALTALAAGAFEARPDLVERKAELAAVNRLLWDIEDDIRDKEAAGAFDETFIALARAVYRRNDERAAIKKAINILLGSGIVEEKSYKDYG